MVNDDVVDMLGKQQKMLPSPNLPYMGAINHQNLDGLFLVY